MSKDNTADGVDSLLSRLGMGDKESSPAPAPAADAGVTTPAASTLSATSEPFKPFGGFSVQGSSEKKEKEKTVVAPEETEKEEAAPKDEEASAPATVTEEPPVEKETKVDAEAKSNVESEAAQEEEYDEEEDEDEEPAGPGPASQLLQSTYEVKVTLADQQADPDSPLFSAKTFEDLGLHPNLLKGLYAMNFSKPSKIQEKALPLLLKNPPDNMIGQSQSGTGKTAAFSLTMLTRVDYGLHKPQAICLAPSRELARQIEQVIQTMGQFVPLKTFLAVKDSWNKSTVVDAQIVVGTPGTVMDMIGRRVLDPKLIKCLVLDEADDMLDIQGLGDHTMRIKRMLPPTCQIVLFSATFNDRVRTFADRFAPHANQIMLRQEELSVEGIKQFYMDCANEDAKYDVLVELYNYLTIGQSIIFCKRRDTADRIANRMISEGHSVASLHGDKDVGDRDAIIDGFRDGKTKVLITTNVIARGIDIQQVNMVVNYDTPVLRDGTADTDTYLHRVGRTGRFGRKGIAILFVSDQQSWTEMKQLETDLGIEMIKIETADFDEMEDTLKREMKK